MKIVKPTTKTTLLLNHFWMPLYVISARVAFNHVLCNRVKPFDKNLIPYDSDSWFKHKDELKTPDMDYTIYADDQPSLRSVSAFWPVPTVVLTTARFYYTAPRGKVSIKYLAKRYKNRCQICEKKFRTNELTIDHVIPQAKHGVDDVENVIPVCLPCNQKKADMMPYFDINGVNLEEKIKKAHKYLIVEPEIMRNEWEKLGVFQA